MRLDEQLFDWAYRDGEEPIMYYFNCTLKVDVGEFKRGTQILMICMKSTESIMEVYTSETEHKDFEIGLIVKGLAK